MPRRTPDTIPNPFAVALKPKQTASKRAMISAVKMILIASICLAVVLVIHRQSRVWLINRYSSNFETQNRDQKISRLVNLAQLGPDAIPKITEALADSDTVVALTAIDLLSDAQDDWALLPLQQQVLHHASFLETARTTANAIPVTRGVGVTGLIRQSLASLSESSQIEAQIAREHALEILQTLSLDQRPSDEIGATSSSGVATDVTTDSANIRPSASTSTRSGPESINPSIRIFAKTIPLPLKESWDQPDNEPITDQGTSRYQIAGSESRVAPSSRSGLQAVSPQTISLKPVDPGSTEKLAENNELRRGTADPRGPDSDSIIQPTTHLVQTPLETLDFKSVVYFLADPDPGLRSDADLELRRRGWTSPQIQLAQALVNGTDASRLALIDQLGAAKDVDPRPWLLLLLDDENRDVRYRIATILATMNDPVIHKRLRQRGLQENDPEIRQILESSAPLNRYR